MTFLLNEALRHYKFGKADLTQKRKDPKIQMEADSLGFSCTDTKRCPDSEGGRNSLRVKSGFFYHEHIEVI